MPIEYFEMTKDSIESDESFKSVKRIAEELREFLNRTDVRDQIRAVDVAGALSQDVQALILPFVKDLGFESERKRIFANTACPGLRPDYFHAKAGIILEVERGKTLMNNMDLLDMWKCHICEQARYLFLIVPKARPTKKGKLLKQFARTKNRLEQFFRPRNYVNFDAVFLFGYGGN